MQCVQRLLLGDWPIESNAEVGTNRYLKGESSRKIIGHDFKNQANAESDGEADR